LDYGGAISIINAELMLSKCLIHDNHADYGAGLFIDDATVIMFDSVISDGEALV
jgi:hypothetical protein